MNATEVFQNSQSNFSELKESIAVKNSARDFTSTNPIYDIGKIMNFNRILLVDDMKFDLFPIENKLTKSRIVYDLAINGLEAFEMYKKAIKQQYNTN